MARLKRPLPSILISICLFFLGGCAAERSATPDFPAGTQSRMDSGAPPIDFAKRQPLTYKMTMAVLPFDDLSGNKEMQTLSRVIPECMISKLQNVRGLHMVERMQIQNLINELKLGETGLIDAKTAQKAGKMLGADTVVIGSYAEMTGELRINVRVVQVETAGVLHAVDATGVNNRVFQLVDRLAERLVTELGIGLNPVERQRMSLDETSSLKAAEYFVRGGDYYSQYNRASYEKALECYREAIRLDPKYAKAYAAMGDVLATLGFSRKKAGEAYMGLIREAKDAAKKAIAIDPNLGDGYRSLARIYGNEFEFYDSHTQAQKAINRNPNDADAWYLLAQAATARNVSSIYDLDKALIYYETSIKLNPRNALVYNDMGWYVFLEKKWYDRAIDVFQRAIQISPNFPEAYDSLGEAYYLIGKYEDAVKQFRKTLDIQPTHRHAGERIKDALRKVKKDS